MNCIKLEEFPSKPIPKIELYNQNKLQNVLRVVFFQIQSLFSFVWPYARPETNIFVVVNRYDNTILFWHKIHFKQAANNLLFLKMGLSLITAESKRIK